MKILMLTAAPTGPRSPFPQGTAERAHIYGVWLTLTNRGHMKPPFVSLAPRGCIVSFYRVAVNPDGRVAAGFWCGYICRASSMARRRGTALGRGEA